MSKETDRKGLGGDAYEEWFVAAMVFIAVFVGIALGIVAWRFFT